MDKRQQYVNRYTQGMADIVLSRYMLNHEALLIYNHIERDQYQDPVVIEEGRFKKLVAVKKNNDMAYVQEFVDDLLEDGLNILPWYINMTSTGLPRIPRMDDNIIVDGVKYTIARVKPMNRNLDSLLTLFIYPSRVDAVDSLWIYDVSFYIKQDKTTVRDSFGKAVIADIIFGGQPTEYSWDGKNWFPWEATRVPIEISPINQFKPPVDESQFVWCNKSIINGGFAQEEDRTIIDGGTAAEVPTKKLDGGDAFSQYLCFYLTDGQNSVAYTI